MTNARRVTRGGGHRKNLGSVPDDPVAVEFFQNQPDAVWRILDEHVDDGTGHCRKCWSTSGNPRHPCNIRLFALRGAFGADSASPEQSDPATDHHEGGVSA